MEMENHNFSEVTVLFGNCSHEMVEIVKVQFTSTLASFKAVSRCTFGQILFSLQDVCILLLTGISPREVGRAWFSCHSHFVESGHVWLHLPIPVGTLCGRRHQSPIFFFGQKKRRG